MIRANRLPGRPSLLVLSIALTLGPAVSDVVARQAPPPEASAGRTTETAMPGPPSAAEHSVAATLAADERRRDRVTMVTAAWSAVATSEADLASGCVGVEGADPVAGAGAHRDDVAWHPGDAPSDGCLLAGPKRFHGDARRAAATAAPALTPATVRTAAPARWSGSYNLYRKTAFVTQKDFTWCVAASVQMMVNIVKHRSDRTAATQQRMITYAQATDHGPWGPGGGTDVTGWITALRHFGAGKYRAVGARAPAAALRLAATAMRQTGRPAGMLVMEGRHAWVLHGFESRTDPKRSRHATITSVRVSGPLYPIQQKHGYDLRPNTELSVRALATFFQPSSVGALVGKYVVIVPVD